MAAISTRIERWRPFLLGVSDGGHFCSDWAMAAISTRIERWRPFLLGLSNDGHFCSDWAMTAISARIEQWRPFLLGLSNDGHFCSDWAMPAISARIEQWRPFLLGLSNGGQPGSHFPFVFNHFQLYRLLSPILIFMKPLEYPECRLTDIGSEYRGQVSVTSSGKNCLPWKDVHNNGSIPIEELENNFCRNPDNRPGGPWCFVDASKWEYCRVPFCKR